VSLTLKSEVQKDEKELVIEALRQFSEEPNNDDVAFYTTWYLFMVILEGQLTPDEWAEFQHEFTTNEILKKQHERWTHLDSKWYYKLKIKPPLSPKEKTVRYQIQNSFKKLWWSFKLPHIELPHFARRNSTDLENPLLTAP